MEPERTRIVRSAAVVGAVAAAVRLAWVLVASRAPQGLADPVIYLDSAASIADGAGYTSLLDNPTAYYPPGYPFFVGAVQWVAESLGLGAHVVTTLGVVQAVLGGVAAAALVVAGALLAPGARGLRIGVLAGSILALWPNLVLHTPLVLSESLFLAAFCVLVASLIAMAGGAGSPDAGSGSANRAGATSRTVLRSPIAWTVVSAAVCTWVRPQAVVVVLPALVVAGVVAGAGWRSALRWALWPVVGIVIAVAPWTLRNAVVMDAFVPMSTNTGDNLCIGFNDAADGRFEIGPECATEGRYVDGPEVEVARDAELRDRALSWIAEHPGRLPGLSASKLVATFAHDTDALAAWESYGADRHLGDATRTALRWLSDVYWWAVAAGALVGSAVVARTWRSGPRRRSSPTSDKAPISRVPTGRDVAEQDAPVQDAQGPDAPGPDDADRRGSSAGPWARSEAWLFVVALGVGQALVPVFFFGDERFKIPVVASAALLAALAVEHLWTKRVVVRVSGGTATDRVAT